MTKLTLLGAAVILVASTLTVPATAQHRAVAHSVGHYAQEPWCPNREPGNPYTKEEDYIAWSGWRARGGWDDRNDFNCGPLRLRYHAAGF
jgi:hypothetical protein